MNDEQTIQTQVTIQNTTKLNIKVYKKRWVIMGIFIYYASINTLQWLEYSSITNLVVKYYNVNTLTVDWTSTIYMAAYPVLVIPVSYLIEMKGLRLAGLIGCIGNLLATVVKLFSINTNLFWVLMFGQTIAAVAQLFIVCLPTKIASVWFKENEVSTACSLGVFGIQLGYALGFLLPTSLVHESDNLNEIGDGLEMLCRVLVGVMAPVTLAVLIYFSAEPKLPPNLAQAALRKNKEKFQNKVFVNTMRQLVFNKGFMIHLIAYSINIAGFNAIAVFLNQLMLQYFPGADEEVGWMGFILVMAGLVGSILFGIILDKTHKYKETSIFLYVFSLVSLLFMMFTMKFELKVMTYISCSLVGLFAIAYMPVGFEFTMELTYPLEECTTTGLVMSSVQFCGVIFTVIMGFLNKVMEGFWTLAVVGAILVVALDMSKQSLPTPLPEKKLSMRGGIFLIKGVTLFLAAAGKNPKASEQPSTSSGKVKGRRKMNDKDACKCSPKIMEAAKRDTLFTRKEIEALYKIYKKLITFNKTTPQGHVTPTTTSAAAIGKSPTVSEGIDRTVFREVLHNTFDIMTENIVMDRIFCVWDKHNCGLITIENWLKGLSLFLKGSLQDQIIYCFAVYDLNSDGFLTKDEMFQLLRNCLIKHPQEEDPDESVKDLVDIVMRKIDNDKDGKVSLQDFQKTVEAEPLLLEAFGKCLPSEESKMTFLTTLKA